MKNALIISVIISFLASGCVSLNTVSLTSIPAKRDAKVRAEASKFIFLGFNFDNDFVDRMTNDLRSQCPDGVVSGILTKDEVVNYFLYIFWSHRVTATGYCSGKVVGRAGLDKKSPRHPSQENSAEVPAAEEI